MTATTLFVLGAWVTILFFSGLLKETGRMTEILEGFRHVFKDMRLVIAMLPAMIGLVPIVGGALVSAPMVVEGSDELELSAERRTFVNYWFRHLWEYVMPTYPGVILAATMLEMPVRRFGWINLPFTLMAVVTGQSRWILGGGPVCQSFKGIGCRSGSPVAYEPVSADTWPFSDTCSQGGIGPCVRPYDSGNGTFLSDWQDRRFGRR